MCGITCQKDSAEFKHEIICFIASREMKNTSQLIFVCRRKTKRSDGGPWKNGKIKTCDGGLGHLSPFKTDV